LPLALFLLPPVTLAYCPLAVLPLPPVKLAFRPKALLFVPPLTLNYLDELSTFKYPLHKYKARYLADNKDFINAYVMMADLKSKANQFWTTEDQILLENYQELAKK